MERILLEILALLRAQDTVSPKELNRILNDANRQAHSSTRKFAKKRLAPYYLKVKAEDPDRWRAWNVDPALEARLMSVIRMKPRRTASGVATITVITKPWRCTSNCRYCPTDIRMPKSYLADEPACQRAERNWFDPYLQVAARLRALIQMGHLTDKVELIVLGGTWCDYPEPYQLWFASELFRALNEAGTPAAKQSVERRRTWYERRGLSNDADELTAQAADLQAQVDAGTLSYNQAIRIRYGDSEAWREASDAQKADRSQLQAQQRTNETAAHRMVGLVIETRPDTITPARLLLIRQLGCTKVQMGVQSLDERVLAANQRTITPAQIARAFALARLFGFKIHSHFMVNLMGSTPEADKADFQRFVTEAPYQPDEIKLYPCALIEGSQLVRDFEAGRWRPYTEDELIDVLTADMLATPPFTRVSRMIRDFSAGDIVAGNKKGNLRQLVDNRVSATCAATGQSVQEMRTREVGTHAVARRTLHMDCVPYHTPETEERFLQWVTPDNRLAGFLRLSLPDPAFVAAHADELPVRPFEAMIREVHVYGKVAALGVDAADTESDAEPGSDATVQHAGLGRALVERACAIAKEHDYTAINVISSVGTREYYRHLDFQDNGLYQQRRLDEDADGNR